MDPPTLQPHQPVPPHRASMPQRISALYQYHNAPEVAPAHGLEYDDAIYPSSDKYPVIREHAFDISNRKFNFENNSKPPRIIFGMKVRTFLVVAAIMTLVVVGAAVGGAVGGQQLRNSTSPEGAGQSIGAVPSVTTTQLPSATTTLPSGTAAAVPTYTPLSDCPASNNTSYTSTFAAGSSGTVPANAGLNFTKYCDLADPLSFAGGNAVRIAEAFVYSFSDCVDVCASYNFWRNSKDCTVAVYQPAGSRPGNCWVGNAEQVQLSSLKATKGTDVAFLKAS